MRKTVISILGAVIAGLIVWGVTRPFEPDPPSPPPSPDPPAAAPRLSCEGTIVAGESVRCLFDIDGPGLFSATLTPGNARTSWAIAVSGLTGIGGTCTAESPTLEFFGPSSVRASGTLTMNCPVSSSTGLEGHEVVFEDRTNITNLALRVDAGFR